jgi:hypothetical protein
MTHPVILILNAMLAHKRVMFLGHGMPANLVARMVLAACAIASGCGQLLRGINESAFPYANLSSLDILEEFSGFVAGVTNPRFEELASTWDVLCNLETGRVTVSKDVKSIATIKGGHTSEISLSNSIVRVEEDAGTLQSKMQAASRVDCTDNVFMDEVSHGRNTDLMADDCSCEWSLWGGQYPCTVHRIPGALYQARLVSRVYASRLDQDRISR